MQSSEQKDPSKWRGAAWPLLQSQLPGLTWPALPSQQGLLLATLLAQLEQSQWQAREEIEQAQLRQLRLLLQHARRHSRFHAEHLAGMASGETRLQERLAALPLMHRTDLQSRRPEIDCAWVPPEHGKPVLAQSTGSTGEPVGVLRTELNGLMWMAMTLREHLWQRRDFGQTLAVIRALIATDDPNREGMRSPDWGSPVHHLFRSGPAHALNLQTDIARQIEWLAQIRPGYLLTYPSNLAGLLDLVEADPAAGAGLRELRQVRTIGETLSDALRARCRRLLQVGIADLYSTQEVGVIACECPSGDGYHAMAEGVVLELLREDGARCAHGEVGRIVVTDLHNFATPLIRYDLGDLAEADETPCACGRGLPKIRRILGRERNLLHLPDGRRLWPLLGSFTYRDIAPVRQYQVVQHDLAHVSLRLATERPLTPDEESRLAARLVEYLGFDCAVRCEYFEGRIPPGPGGKFEDFVSEIGRRG